MRGRGVTTWWTCSTASRCPTPSAGSRTATDPEVQAWTSGPERATRAVLDALPARAGLRGAPGRAARRAHGRRRAGGRRPAVHRRAGRRPRPGRAVRPRRGRRPRRPSPACCSTRSGFHGEETAALDWYRPSRDGGLVAVGTSLGGDERSTLRVIDVETGELLARRAPEHPGRLGRLAARRDRASPTPATPTPTRCRPRSAATTGRSGGTSSAPTRATDDRRVRRPARPDRLARGVAVEGRPLVPLPRRPRAGTASTCTWSDRTTGDARTVIEGVDAVAAFEVVGRPPRRHDDARRATGPRRRGAARRPDARDLADDLRAEGRSVIEGVAVTARSLLVRSTRSAVSRLDHYDLHGGEHRDVPLPGKADGRSSLDGSDDRDEAWVALTSFARPPRAPPLDAGAARPVGRPTTRRRPRRLRRRAGPLPVDRRHRRRAAHAAPGRHRRRAPTRRPSSPATAASPSR